MPDHINFPSLPSVSSIMIGVGAAIFLFLGIITTFVFGCWISLGFCSLVLLTLFLLSPGTLDRRQRHLFSSRPRSLIYCALATIILTVIAFVFALTSLLFAVIFIFLIAAFFAYTVVSFTFTLLYTVNHTQI